MYNNLYITYNIQRTGRDCYWRGVDTTELKVEVVKISFKKVANVEYGDIAQRIGDTTRYDCQDAVYDVDRQVTQILGVDAKKLVQSERLYLIVPVNAWMPWMKCTLPTQVYLDEVPDVESEYHVVDSYDIEKDEETWNIKLV